MYVVRSLDGQVLELPEHDLEPMGDFEAPFRYGEVVQIFPVDLETDPEVVTLIGKRGIVSGIEPEDETNGWAIYVAVQNGETWYFTVSELRGTGYVLPREVWRGENGPTVRVRVDPVTREGTIVSGNSPISEPAPLLINLENLVVEGTPVTQANDAV